MTFLCVCKVSFSHSYRGYIDIYLDVVIVVTQEFRSSFRLLLQTTELLVGTVFPLLLLTCGRCVLFFDVFEKKLFSQCPKISVLLFNDGLDMRMENFSCRHSWHIFSPGAYGFTFFIISHLMLKSVFFFFQFPNVVTKGCSGSFVFRLE